MKKIISLTLLASTSVLFLPATLKSAGVGAGQKKRGECVQARRKERVQSKVGQVYFYTDYVLCSPGMDPPRPLVRVWMTTRVDPMDEEEWGPSPDGADLQIEVEKWVQGRDGADLVSVFRDGKRSYTLFRDLDAVPLTLLTAEGRSAVPAETGRQHLLMEGRRLIPLDNLTPESAERVKQVFEGADALVRLAQRKTTLSRDTKAILAVVDSLASPPETQN